MQRQITSAAGHVDAIQAIVHDAANVAVLASKSEMAALEDSAAPHAGMQYAQRRCTFCNGTGLNGAFECPYCRGTGRL